MASSPADIKGQRTRTPGYKLPTLLDQLRAILEQYRDGGQILKELLQNAEDAGARHVAFLYDKHQHGTDPDKLHHPGLAQFQGPALYSYNDAQFTPEDWDGVWMIHKSVKSDNALQVGRFGLGFKSVHHVTDLPWILSGDRLAALDPHVHYFTFQGKPVSGFEWELPEDWQNLCQIPHQYQPFLGLFGCNRQDLEQGSYNGTMFRFPLRTEPSEVSPEVYTPDKVGSLFDSFQAECHLALLFLKHVDHIEVLERDMNSNTPKLLYSVQVDPKCVTEVKECRRRFMQKIDVSGWMPEHEYTVYYISIVSMVMQNGRQQVSRHQYLVCEYFAGGRDSATLQHLHSTVMAGHMPLVGVAMAIKRDEEWFREPSGQVFCFLPLNTEQRSATGLPVHINGYFSLSQDRHHVNLPAPGQSVKSDSGLQWNLALMEDLLPRAHVQLLVEAVQRYEQLRPLDVYRAVPDRGLVCHQWTSLLKPFMQRLFKKNIFYSPGTAGSKGTWVKVMDAIFVDMLGPVMSSVTTILREAGRHVVDCPAHMLRAVRQYGGQAPTFVTPALLHETLQDCPSLLEDASRDVKLHLLEFLLNDPNIDLEDLELLPTADGHFCVFSPEEPDVYVVSTAAEHELLQECPEYVLHPHLSPQLSSALMKLAKQGETRLMELTPEHVLTLLPELLPYTTGKEADGRCSAVHQRHVPVEDNSSLIMLSGDHLKWLDTLWDYLRSHFPSNLDAIQGQLLLPVETNKGWVVLKLERPSKVVLASHRGNELTRCCQGALQALGVHVIQRLREKVACHAAVVGKFVLEPNPRNVLSAAYGVYTKQGELVVNRFRYKTQYQGRSDLRQLWSRLTSLNSEHVDFLKKLPLFSLLSGQPSVLYSMEEVSVGGPVEEVPLKPHQNMLDLCQPDARVLADRLGLQPMTLVRYMKEVFNNSLRNDELEVAISFVIQNWTTLQNQDPHFPGQVKKIKFVMNSSGLLVTPDSLFDPEENFLQKLFHGESKFPVGKFSANKYMPFLRSLGLRNKESVTAAEIKNSAMILGRLPNSKWSADYKIKSVSIMKALNDNPKLTSWDLRSIRWLVTAKTPSNYPSSLNWFGGATMCEPRNAYQAEWSLCVGGVAPVLASNLNTAVRQALQCDRKPGASVIVQQLKLVVAHYTAAEKPAYLTSVQALYKSMCNLDKQELLDAMEEENLECWVWQGDGFTDIHKAIVEQFDLDLKPHCYHLPGEIKQYGSLLAALGVRQEVTIDILLEVLEDIKECHTADAQLAKRIQTHDFQLCIEILDILKSNVENMSLEQRERILLPIEGSQIALKSIKECAHCSTKAALWSLPVDISVVHRNVPIETAMALGVQPLKKHAMNIQDIVVAYGQEECLTSRLNNLLDDYTDGFSIPKELIQNADDAGASVVKFMYDQRDNADHMELLIDDGMKAVQGPALWAYNDAKFSKRDFDNLVKLGGATKELDRDKIGKFGLGFNAVYNMTDVPSVLSGKVLAILDPNKYHLDQGLVDTNKAGIRIPMDSTKLQIAPDQFHPYQHVFGYEIDSKGFTDYPATLFRFPLRTRSQAERSEISSVCYNEDEMEKLLVLFLKNVENLLLFTQNVECVEVFHLPKHIDDPRNAHCLFRVHRHLDGVIRDKELVNTQEDFFGLLKFGTRRMAGSQPKGLGNATAVMTVKLEVTETGRHYFNVATSKQIQKWVVSRAFGTDMCLPLAEYLKLPPVASMALPLLQEGGVLSLQSLKELGLEGRLFCFLPLPITAKLPAHINAPFALESSRRKLVERTEDDKDNRKAKWNDMLWSDVILAAYQQLLVDLAGYLKSDSIQYMRIWPAVTDMRSCVTPLIQAFYDQVATQSILPASKMEGKIVYLKEAVFFDKEIESDSTIIGDAKQLLRTLQTKPVVELPECVKDLLLMTGHKRLIKEQSYTKERFMIDIFLGNICYVSDDVRKRLVFYALKMDNSAILVKLKENPCIPVSPKGKVWKKPVDLIHPSEAASKLYTMDDGRFPHGEEFNTVEILFRLKQLGMQGHDIGWEDVIERASSFASKKMLSPLDRKNLKLLWDFIDKKLQDVSHIEEAQRRLQEIHFIPVLDKPKDYPVKWHGSHSSKKLLAAEDLFIWDDRYLVSCTQHIADTGDMSRRLITFLGLQNKPVPLITVMDQLDEVLKSGIQDPNKLRELQEIHRSVYSYLQYQLAKDRNLESVFRDRYSGKDCILSSKSTYCCPRNCVFEFPDDCPPYLCSLPLWPYREVKEIMQVIGVRENLTQSDLIGALEKMEKDHNGRPLDPALLRFSISLLQRIGDHVDDPSEEGDDISQVECGPVCVPDSNSVLRLASALCYNDCPWMEPDNNLHLAHKNINKALAFKMGVEMRRYKEISSHSTGIPFGQKEKLTRCIQRILKDYPTGLPVFQELIQNADDAKATSMHFILDVRSHHTTRVFSESWKKLQGPALCVWSDSAFTNADIEGIQAVGEGAKEYKPEKTGQYGVGFNAVYHITDAPSLLTSGKELGEVLCVFDPTCSFVPGATQAEPGRKYDDLQELQVKFPHVFTGYMRDTFCQQNSTMFRLPLRKDRSKLSQDIVTIEKMKQWLWHLRFEAMEMLLFMNNLNEIKISEMGDRGLWTQYTAKCKEKEGSQRQFSTLCQNTGQMIASKTCDLLNVPVHIALYEVHLTDSDGRKEMWKLSQRMGINRNVIVPETVRAALRDGKLCVLPKGGVACRIHAKPAKGKEKPDQTKGRVFCTLPLPVETALPVYVNGNFALGHENRQHFTLNPDGSYRGAWNAFLCKEVIAHAYLNLILSLRMYGTSAKFEGDTALVSSTPGELDRKLKQMQRLFPVFKENSKEWSVLVRALYVHASETSAPIIPVCQRSKDVQGCTQVQWFPPCSDTDGRQVMLSTETDRLPLLGTLRDCGMQIANMTKIVIKSFEAAEVEVCTLSPSEVMNYLASDSASFLLGKHIKETPFRGLVSVMSVIEYCMEDKDFYEKLDGLPFCITADLCVHRFSKEKPVIHFPCVPSYPQSQSSHEYEARSYPSFLCHNKKIIPECGAYILHELVFLHLKSSALPVLRQMTIQDVAGMLPFCIDGVMFRNPCTSQRDTGSVLSRLWLRDFWAQICKIIKQNLGTSPNPVGKSVNLFTSAAKKDLSVKVKQYLAPLSSWCLLPVTSVKGKHFHLIGEVAKVLNLDYDLAVKHKAVKDAIEAFGVPKLDLTTLDLDSWEYLSAVVTGLDELNAVLSIVYDNYQTFSEDCKAEIAGKQGHILLEYLSAGKYDGSEKQKIRQLPLFTTVNDVTLALGNSCVYVIPKKVPTTDMDAWRRQSGVIFLKEEEELKSLYTSLDCKVLGVEEIYCKYILQHFELLSEHGRDRHLHFLFRTYRHAPKSTEQTKIVEILKHIPIIPDQQGELQPACEFYDPENVVFSIMIQDDFPPKTHGSFSEKDWLDCLRWIGLRTEVTMEMMIQFAKEIELKTSCKRMTYQKAKEKATFLINYIVEMDADDLRRKILLALSDINFIYPAQMPEGLVDIHEAYDADITALLRFRDGYHWSARKLIWTVARTLPEWVHSHREKDLEIMHVSKTPPPELVAKNLKNICMKEEKSPLSDQVVSVIRHAYTYLRDNMVTLEGKLSQVPCIMVDGSTPLVKPSCTVLNIMPTDEIPPYLCKVPAVLGEFYPLFKKLGSQEFATIDQYALVLEGLRKDIGDEKLNVNEVQMAYKAMSGLFTALQKSDGNHSELHTVYLLSRDRRLLPSNLLQHDDCPWYRERMQSLDVPTVVNLHECPGLQQWKQEELLDLLPIQVRVDKLSLLVKEVLVENTRNVAEETDISKKLNDRIHAKSFCWAVLQLIQHESSNSLDEELSESVRQKLCKIYIQSIDDLKTELVYLDGTVSNSQQKQILFCEKVMEENEMEDQVSDDEDVNLVENCHWNIFISPCEDQYDILVPLSVKLNEILGSHLKASLVFVPPLLHCDLDEMARKLDIFNISQIKDAEIHCTRTLPQPGATLQHEDREWVMASSSTAASFSPGEYVAYKANDESDFVYAVFKGDIDGRSMTIDTGRGNENMTALPSQLRKIVRHDY